MILAFKEEINGKKTYFAEKILKMYALNEINAGITINFWELSELNKNDKTVYKNYINYPAKLHTIRTDVKNRWKSDKRIHCVYHNRTKKQFQFCPTFECKGVQKIQIYPTNSYRDYWQIIVDGRTIYHSEAVQLATNDGFDSLHDFLEYFNKDFTGKIIHFTDFKY